MKFIVDAQLPPALARYLEARGHEAVHVDENGLRDATDKVIWAFAKESRAIIVTKDEDFALMRIWDPRGPPVIWIRIGNTTKRKLLHRLDATLARLLAAIERGEKLVELTE